MTPIDLTDFGKSASITVLTTINLSISYPNQELRPIDWTKASLGLKVLDDIMRRSYATALSRLQQ